MLLASEDFLGEMCCFYTILTQQWQFWKTQMSVSYRGFWNSVCFSVRKITDT